MEVTQRNELIDIVIQNLQHAKTNPEVKLDIWISEADGFEMKVILKDVYQEFEIEGPEEGEIGYYD